MVGSLSRVGVVGHRLDMLSAGAVEVLEKVFAEVCDELSQLASVDERVLVSTLAEGASRIAAAAALDQGWSLEVLLPFSQPRYEEDFPRADSIAEFQALLARAQSVEALDGEGQAAPYAQLGRTLLTRIEFLLAVWNGAPKRGPGGTAEVIENALAAGIPVLWISPDGASCRLLLPDHPIGSAALRLAAGRWPLGQLPSSAQG